SRKCQRLSIRVWKKTLLWAFLQINWKAHGIGNVWALNIYLILLTSVSSKKPLNQSLKPSVNAKKHEDQSIFHCRNEIHTCSMYINDKFLLGNSLSKRSAAGQR